MKTKLLFGLLVLSIFILVQCSEKKDPVSVSTHPEDWSTTNSANFHGNAITDGSLSQESCQTCHGTDYQGGTSGVSCYNSSCHSNYPHPEGFADSNSPNFHTHYIADANWDIIPCQQCHGTDYAGKGVSEKSCVKCHTAPDGPEACNTCHGGSANAAPPVNLMNMTSTSELTVGAHQEHVAAGTWSTFSSGTCQTCHIQPSRYSDPGHIDDTPHAEIIFNSLASDGGRLHPSWDRITGSCDNVYCHGPFEFKKSNSQYPWAYADSAMVGKNPRLFWQYPGTNQVLCGTCHNIPPQGHAPVASCTGCHASVVDENLNIVNKFLHINGKIDVFN